MDDRRKTLSAILVIIVVILIVVLLIWSWMFRGKLISPVPEDSGIKIIFITPTSSPKSP